MASVDVGTVAPSGSGPSSAAMRCRSSRANSGRGASGTTGSRNASNGSVIAPPFVITGAERAAGAHEQRFGGVDAAIEMLRDLADRQSVEIAQRQRGSMVRTERRKHFPSSLPVEARVHVVVDDHRVRVLGELKSALFACCPPPVVDELVARD